MLGSDSQISKICRKMRIRPHNKIWGCIHKYLYIIEKCGFVPKRKYLITKMILVLCSKAEQNNLCNAPAISIGG